MRDHPVDDGCRLGIDKAADGLHGVEVLGIGQLLGSNIFASLIAAARDRIDVALKLKFLNRIEMLALDQAGIRIKPTAAKGVSRGDGHCCIGEEKLRHRGGGAGLRGEQRQPREAYAPVRRNSDCQSWSSS